MTPSRRAEPEVRRLGGAGAQLANSLRGRGAGGSSPLRISLALAALVVSGCDTPARPLPGNSGETIAYLGSVPVSRHRFLAYLREAHGAGALAYPPEVKSQLLDQFLEEELMLGYARERSPRRSPPLVRAAARTFISAEIERGIEIGERDIYNAYEARRTEFFIAEGVRAQHILVAERTQAEQLLRRLRQGEDFDRLAREHSTAADAANGGDLGIVRRGQLPPYFEEALFKLPEGKLSGILDTDYGFHLLRVRQRYRDYQIPLSGVTAELRAALRRERTEAAYQELLGRLRRERPARVMTRALSFRYSGALPSES